MKTKNKKHAPKSETRYVTPDPLRPRRNGKIAALDRDTREALNRQLRDNHTSDDILSWLNGQPAVKEVLDKQFKGQAINRGNLAEWRSGGYRDWENQECVLTWWEKKTKELAEKGGNPYQLGHQMAQIHAGQFLATLSSLMATAPTAEVRMKQLSKAMMEFRGWRRADYHAESMALEKENSKWRRERETQELELKKQALELQRDRYQRRDAEYLLKACNDPKMRAVADNDELSYAEQVRAARIFMFGDDDEPEESPESEVGSQGSDAANGEKTTVESQGLAGSEGVSGTQKNKPVSNMSDAERKAFYEAYLGMLLDLNAAGEDLREIDGFNDAENKHAALKAKQEEEEEEEEEDEENIEHPTSNIEHPEKEDEAPTSKHQAPEKDQSSNPNEDDTVEKEIETAGGATLPDADNLQPSTCNLEHSSDPEPSAEGSMTVEQADKVVSEWRALARRNCGPFINHSDVAELSAYLSGKPRPWYSLKSYDLETMHPPLRDPRFNPASPWCKVWPHIKTQVNLNEKN